MIFLHIGRGKAGSTTIQDLLAVNRSRLHADGFRVPDIRIGAWIKSVDRGQSGKGGEIESSVIRLGEEIIAQPEARFLISSEYFMRLATSDKLAAIQAVFRGHDIRIQAYLRDYPSLITSLYNQATKKGKNVANFDRYFERKKHEIRAIAPLTAWANAFGWERLRLRSLDPISLTGGDLVDDYLSAVGIDGATDIDRSSATDANKSKNWMTVEMIRGAVTKIDPKDARTRRKVIAGIEKAVRRLTERDTSLSSAAQYLTPDQWNFLSNLYNEDMVFLAQNCPDAVLPRYDSPPPGARAFLPSEEHLPGRLKAVLEKIMNVNVSPENIDVN